MKTQIKNSIGNFLFVAVLSAMMISGCSCSAPKPDPLAGFHAASKILDQSIVNDYQNYIQNLSPEEKQNLGPYPASFFEDGTGRHAVRIEIGINGKEWEHVLIYDKDNKQIKTIKYVAGHYAS